MTFNDYIYIGLLSGSVVCTLTLTERSWFNGSFLCAVCISWVQPKNMLHRLIGGSKSSRVFVCVALPYIGNLPRVYPTLTQTAAGYAIAIPLPSMVSNKDLAKGAMLTKLMQFGRYEKQNKSIKNDSHQEIMVLLKQQLYFTLIIFVLISSLMEINIIECFFSRLFHRHGAW